MPPTEAFQRNADRVAGVVDTIPAGRCTTYGAIGKALGIVPRYVALIMATAPDISAAPWHRVVGANATVRPGSHASEQKRRLHNEGFELNGNSIIDFGERFIQP